MKRVIVIGAGPAGSATAMALRGHSRQVETLLLERRPLPRTKVCASGLSPWTLSLLDELGVGSTIRKEAHRIDGAIIGGADGPGLELRGHHETAVLLRERFDYLLVQEALRRGTELRDGVRVRELLRHNDRIVGVRTDEDTLEADAVVDCSGATGQLSSDRRRGLRLHTIMGWYEGIADGSDLVEIYFDAAVKPHYGWVFPEGPRRANVGIVYAPGQGPAARERFARFCERRLAERLRGAAQIGKLVGHPVDTCTIPRALGGPGWLAAGEAARLVDMATAEGIFHALVSGTAAGQTLARTAPGEVLGPRQVRAYTRAIRLQLAARLALGRGLMHTLQTPALDWILRFRGAESVRLFLRRAFTQLYHA